MSLLEQWLHNISFTVAAMSSFAAFEEQPVEKFDHRRKMMLAGLYTADFVEESAGRAWFHNFAGSI
ncbi:MAG: hypothetical protein IPO38_04995 [Rhodocyclaceae bacterium]|nr:hypothetical protein [Rhodocyclaceae bacterium]